MSKIKALALAALSLASVTDATVTAQPTEQKQTVQNEKALPTKQIKQEREIKYNNLGGIEYTPFDGGTPPKYYGQHLQSIGQQKWIKRKK
jgi:hypothetical protein